MLKKVLILLLISIFALTASLTAQTKYFGKNKVQYQTFKWQYLQTRHFDIYFADQMYETGKFAATVLESAYTIVADQLNYKLQSRIPVFIYNSPNEFQQTNIISGYLPEGVGGFTEAFKKRIAVPFNGSLEDFRHVLHHELTHALTYDMLFGNLFSSLVSRQRFFNVPLWLAEGFAEYSSRFGWDYFADMVVRDATINNYLTPPEYLTGYLAYKQGQAMVKFIADNYGRKKIGDVYSKGKAFLTIDKALKAAIGVDTKEFWEDFSLEMKRRYWPEIARRKEVDEIAKNLTNHKENSSNFNSKPVFSPKGDRLAIFSDRSDYIEIYLISVIDGQIIDRLVKAERSGDLESLHSYLSGIAFSPDGEKIAFVVKKQGKDALYFLNIDNHDIYARRQLDFNSILSPNWSPDGTKIAFSALNNGVRDIYIYDLENDEVYPCLRDAFDDMEPAWFPDSKRLIFSSDRSHPDNAFVLDNPDYEAEDSLNYWTLYNTYEYGNYSLFTLDIENRTVTPFPCGPGQNRQPAVSPDGSTICFVSNRNGIDNLYLAKTDTAVVYPITDVLTGCETPSWSPDGEKIAFSSFNKAGFDVFVMKDWIPAGKNGRLEPTNYVKGLYDKPSVEEEQMFAMTTASAGDSLLSEGSPNDSLAIEPVDPYSDEDDTTRVEDGEYIFVAEKEAEPPVDPLADLFEEKPLDSTASGPVKPPHVAMFDSVAASNRFPSGEYKVYDYKVKFTPDFVSGGFSYDTFFGLRGQSVFVFSDYLGNHQFILATDLVNTIDQTNFQLFYLYNRERYNLGAGIFHTKNYYLDPDDFLFSDRFYGAQLYFAWPFSKFSRFEILGSQFFIDRKYQDFNDTREDRSSRVATMEMSFVKDNIIWGITGPLNGSRYRIDFDGALDVYSKQAISYYGAEADYRRYLHINGLFSFAYRFAGGASWGKTPKQFFLGGVSNKIGSTIIDAEVYDVENLYFSDVVTPLRGFDYFDLSGTRYFLVNLEFRYPFVDYLKMNFPLPLTIGYVTGNIFFDAGSAWSNDSEFKGFADEKLRDIKAAFGFGIRANLGIFVLRYDLAWQTNLNTVSAKPKYYFSIGADF